MSVSTIDVAVNKQESILSLTSLTKKSSVGPQRMNYGNSELSREIFPLVMMKTFSICSPSFMNTSPFSTLILELKEASLRIF